MFPEVGREPNKQRSAKAHVVAGSNALMLCPFPIALDNI